jgi:hypothetical protein
MIAAEFAREGVMLPIFRDHPDADARNKEPSAGRFRIEVREDGVWAVAVDWSDSARDEIADGGWAYHSPEFLYTDDDVRRVTKVLADALVQEPATLHQTPITASKDVPAGMRVCRAGKMSIQGSAEDGDNHPTQPSINQKDNNMDEKTLKAIGVADEAEAVAAFTTLKAQAAKSTQDVADAIEKASKAEAVAAEAEKMVASVVEAAGCDSADKVLGTVASLKEKASKADEVSKALAEMKDKADEAEKVRLIESARCSKSTADFLAKQTLAVVKDFCEAHKDAPEVPEGSQSASASAAPAAPPADTAERAEVKKMYLKRGMSEDDAEARTSKHMEARAKLSTKLSDAEPGVMTAPIG